MTDRELHTILAALRMWQRYLEYLEVLKVAPTEADYVEAYHEIATNCGDHPPLDADEIDTLVERLNVPRPAPPPGAAASQPVRREK